MRIVHRISFTSSPERQRELARLGVVVAAVGPVTLEVDESLASWPKLSEWLQRHRVVDFVSTKFTPKELDEARWLALAPEWHCGYPQPDEGNFGYRLATYDVTALCDRCGIGMRQIAPFQMKGEPKWGAKGILQLNWVFDEYFVTPAVWKEVFKPHQVPCRPVMNTRGEALRTVVQLVVEEECSIDVNGLPFERCSQCDRIKYLPVTRGPFPGWKGTPGSLMARTRESFGSGAGAFKGVLVAAEIARTLRAKKVRGVSLKPARLG